MEILDQTTYLLIGMNLWVCDPNLHQCEKQLGHVTLTNQIVNYMSRMKMSGHAGTCSHLNFCLYCKTKRLYLAECEAFSMTVSDSNYIYAPLIQSL